MVNKHVALLQIAVKQAMRNESGLTRLVDECPVPPNSASF